MRKFIINIIAQVLVWELITYNNSPFIMDILRNFLILWAINYLKNEEIELISILIRAFKNYQFKFAYFNYCHLQAKKFCTWPRYLHFSQIILINMNCSSIDRYIRDILITYLIYGLIFKFLMSILS